MQFLGFLKRVPAVFYAAQNNNLYARVKATGPRQGGAVKPA